MTDWRFWRWRRDEDHDLDRELDTHLALEIEEQVERGMSRPDARLAAHRVFGSIALTKEELRDMRRGAALEQLMHEVRHAARRLVRSPAFSLVSVLTLALAIAANAAIFAVVERVVLNPLPYPDSDRLVELDHGAAGIRIPSGMGTTQGLYYHYADRSRTLEQIAIYRTDAATLTGDGDPERVRITYATPSLASVLRVTPALGRWFSEADGVPGAAPVALLSHGLWLRRYGADPRILGRPLALAGVPTVVVGVMPQTFAFPDPRVDLLIVEQISRATGFGLWNYKTVGRLRAGATVERTRDELAGLIADLPRAYPNDKRVLGNSIEIGLVATVKTLKDVVIGGVAVALWTLLASVGLVLAVACANVANLFLVRSEARQREIAVREALGASRLSIARYYLTESAWLASVGGLLGVGLAWGAVRLLVSAGPATLPRLAEIDLDGMVLVFTFAVSVLAAVALGAIPLWRVARLGGSLHDSGRGNTASRRSHRARHLLMGAQVALALVLLVASGLMIRSFQSLRALDPGFDGTSTLTFSVGLAERDYPTQRAAIAAHHAILDRLAALPSVAAVSATTCLPLAGGCSGNTLRVERRVYQPDTLPSVAMFRAVAGGYFETMGMRVLRGRSISRADVDHREQIVVVNQALAHRFFPNQDPIGERVASNRLEDLSWLMIVGVVADTPVRTLGEADPMPQVYMPMSIAGGPGIPRSALVGPDVAMMNYVVRSSTRPIGLLPGVRRAIDAIDKNLALAQVGTLQEMLDRASAQMGFTMVLLAIAAGVTLILGVIGIYGVMSYVVSRRTGEIGVRLALGAEPASIAGMIVRQGGLVALAGVVVGLAAALAGTRLIASLLYGVGPRDPAVFVATASILLIVALLACWLPARRAARLSPLEALRTE